VSEHASGPLYRCSTLNSGFIGFGGVGHALMVQPTSEGILR
jgi:hypothetical protein